MGASASTRKAGGLLTAEQKAEIVQQVGVVPTSEWATDASELTDLEAARAEVLRLRRIIHNVHDAITPAPPLGPGLDALDDGVDASLVVLALSRVPFMTHGTLRVVCRRLRTIIASRAFREWHHASDQRLMLLQPEHAKGAEPGARLARRSSACFSFARSVRLAR